MVKNKNRKKELKREKRISEKVIQLSDYQTTENDFLETGVRPDFDRIEGILDHFQMTGEQPPQHELEYLLNSLIEDSSEEDGWFVEIMGISNSKKRIRELKKFIATYPRNLEAQFQLFIETFNGVLNRQSLEELLSIQTAIIGQWGEMGFTDWFDLEARSHLRILAFMVEIYLTNGFSNLALDLVELLRAKIDDGFPPGFVHTMLATYLTLYRFDQIEEIAQWMRKREWEDDGLLVYQILVSLLQGDFTRAEDLFEDLATINSETTLAFDSEFWLETVSYAKELPYYRPYTRESIYMAISSAVMFLETKSFLCESLFDLSMLYEDKSPTSPQKLFEFSNQVFMEGIGLTKARDLFLAGINSRAILESKTEKEILAIKGIGLATVKTLKENGIIFKKDKS